MQFTTRYRDALGRDESTIIEADSVAEALEKADDWCYSLRVGNWMRENAWSDRDKHWLKGVVGVCSLQLFI